MCPWFPHDGSGTWMVRAPAIRQSAAAATLTAPVPERVCSVAQRPSASAALSSPKMSFAESVRKVASPSIGRYSLSMAPLASAELTRLSASTTDGRTSGSPSSVRKAPCARFTFRGAASALKAATSPRIGSAGTAWVPCHAEWREAVAAAAAWAIGELRSEGGSQQPETSLPPLKPQGEFRFAPASTAATMRLATEERYSAVADAAHGGDGTAQHTLGLLHYSGVGGAQRDERESAYWHAAAAVAGNVEALATLGGCVRRGVGAELDEAAGLDIITACAAAGSPVGLVKLGVCHEDGDLPGKPADAQRAAALFESAASVWVGGEPPSESESESEASPPPRRRSALALFQHGFAQVYGIGTRRDVEAGAAAWLSAAKLAPDDGAEEAAWGLYSEQGSLSPALRRRVHPDRCLRLSAALEYAPAVAELARRGERTGQRDEAAEGERRRKRFTRQELSKARSWTGRDERAEAYLEQLLGGGGL
mmetsp:Transcript_27471/g.85952  ORF Transcript_27471/g.85952 Transcript_27471/m.85952 type:complete len:480 (-) Transcript_27471:120-1559(-)